MVDDSLKAFLEVGSRGEAPGGGLGEPCLGDRYSPRLPPSSPPQAASQQNQSLQTQVEQFLRYRQELLDWNTRMNLTAITDPVEVQIKHFLDSLSLLIVYDRPGTRLLDIGAGAGFPGLPLKIVRPAWQVVLLEATAKKVTFLQHIIETLQLQDVIA